MMRMQRLCVIALSVWAASCAAKLPRRHDQKPVQAVTEVPLEKLNFNLLGTDETVNVKDYMEKNDKEFLLLMFGSVGCEVCNLKAKGLTRDYLHQHPLFLTDEGKKFQLMGVNTDSGRNRQVFLSIWGDNSQRHNAGYDFVGWGDPKGDVMKEYLLPPGHEFGVPFTVFLNKRGILWLYTNSDHYELDELLDRVVATMNGEGNSSPRPRPSASPSARPTAEPQPVTGLAIVAPGRLRSVNVQSCSGASVELDSLFKDANVKVVQVDNGRCGPQCQSNAVALKQFEDACSVGGDKRINGRSCAVVNLATTNICDQNPNTYVGGKQFYEVFGSLFNWSYTPNMNASGVPVSIPEPTGPLTLAFNNDGKLIYSSDKSVDTAALVSAMNAKDYGSPAYGPDFQFYADLTTPNVFTESSFKTWRQKANYSVVSGFAAACGGCVVEVDARSGGAGPEHDVYQYCLDSGGFCQIIASEATARNPGESMEQTLQKRMGSIRSALHRDTRFRMPLALDPTLVGDDFGRIWDYYFFPLFPAWNGLAGTIVYDREGKIIQSFPFAGEGADPLLDFLKSLRGR